MKKKYGTQSTRASLPHPSWLCVDIQTSRHNIYCRISLSAGLDGGLCCYLCRNWPKYTFNLLVFVLPCHLYTAGKTFICGNVSNWFPFSPRTDRLPQDHKCCGFLFAVVPFLWPYRLLFILLPALTTLESLLFPPLVLLAANSSYSSNYSPVDTQNIILLNSNDTYQKYNETRRTIPSHLKTFMSLNRY